MEKQKRQNNKVYYYKYPTSIYVLYGIFCVGLLAPAIYNLLKVLEVANLVSYFKELEIFSVVFCLVAIAIVTAFLFLNRFIITETEFIYQKFTKKVYSPEKLLTIKRQNKTGLIVLYVEDETKEDYIGFIVLSVFPSKRKQIIEDIRNLNYHVSVEDIDDNEK